MTLEITFSWWIAPLLFSAICIVWGLWNLLGSDAFDFLAPLIFMGCIILSLVAWLIWAVLT